MKKFKSTEEGIWNEVIRTVTNDVVEETLTLATPEETAELQKIYLANKPRLDDHIEYALISASIKMDENYKSGNIRARINGRHLYIEIK